MFVAALRFLRGRWRAAARRREDQQRTASGIGLGLPVSIPWRRGTPDWRMDFEQRDVESVRKIHVQGQVSWGEHRFSVSLSGNTRSITGNGLPDHATGVFPIQPDDAAAQYDRNPNRIQNQHYKFTLPATPTVARRPSCLPMGAIGILKSGVVFFNALDAAGRDGGAHEIQDACAGHPERQGRYHYHSLSPCVPDSGNGHSDLMGYAFDGFGVFGYRGQDGQELTNSQLDACHGHVHEIPWDNKTVLLYHYHMTREYPYTLGCFSGTPAVSQRPQPPMFHEGPDRRPPFRRGSPPPPRPF